MVLRRCVTDELLDIPNLAELEAAVAADEALTRIQDRKHGMVVFRTREVRVKNLSLRS